MSLKATNAAAGAMLAALTTLVNGGSIKIYTGAAPTNVETAATGTLLATLALSATAFGAPSSSAGTDAVATANAVTSATAVATGTAGYFRVCNSSGTAIWQGAIGTSGSDLNIGTVSISSGGTIAVSSFTVTQPVLGA